MSSFFSSETLHGLTLIVTVAALLLGAFWTLRAGQEAQQVMLAGFEARLTIAERALATRADAEERFAAEMRAALTIITNGVADLRVQEAKKR